MGMFFSKDTFSKDPTHSFINETPGLKENPELPTHIYEYDIVVAFIYVLNL